MHKYRHMARTEHAGLGAGMASGSPSGVEKKKTYINALRPNLLVVERERARAIGKVYLTGGG